MSNVVNFRAFQYVSTLLRRLSFGNIAGKTFDGRRDLYAALGYSRDLAFEDYYSRYERGDIASRVVDAFPMATWRNPPKIKAIGKHPSFDKAWEEFQKENSVYHYLERIDRLSGVGQYGILLMGLSGADGMETTAFGGNKNRKLLYLSPFTQVNAEIKELESDVTNPRFGLPKTYIITLGEVRNLGQQTTRIRKIPVHHSRVLHIAEGLNEDEIYGTPRMQKVWNRLDDLDKVLGGSSEAVWRTGDRGIQFNIDPEANLGKEEEEAFTAEIEEYMNQMKRYIRTQGIEANVLGSDVADPKSNFEVLISVISGTTGIPQRILLGSEVGQLASTQDERNFIGRIKERQDNYATPKILIPFIERCIQLGLIPEPKGGYEIDWPDLSQNSLKDKADVAARFGQAIGHVAKHRLQGGLPLISVAEFRTKFLELPAEMEEDSRDKVKPPKIPQIGGKTNAPANPK